MPGSKYTFFQQQQIKQLVLECDVQRFTTEESLAYIKGRLKIDISQEHYFITKRNLKRTVESRLKHLREHRTAFIEQCFRRIDEIEKYMKELWASYHKHPNNPYYQLNCIRELHQLTVTLANIYEVLPQITGVGYQVQPLAKDISEYEKEYRRKQAVF